MNKTKKKKRGEMVQDDFTIKGQIKANINGEEIILDVQMRQNDNEDLDVEVNQYQGEEWQQRFEGTIAVVAQCGS